MIDLDASFTAASDLFARAQANSVRLTSALGEIETNQRPRRESEHEKDSREKQTLNEPRQDRKKESVDAATFQKRASTVKAVVEQSVETNILSKIQTNRKETMDHTKPVVNEIPKSEPASVSFGFLDDISPPDLLSTEMSDSSPNNLDGTIDEIQQSDVLEKGIGKPQQDMVLDGNAKVKQVRSKVHDEINTIQAVHKQLIGMNEELLNQQQKLIDKSYSTAQQQMLNQIYFTQKLQDVQLEWHNRRQLELTTLDAEMSTSRRNDAPKGPPKETKRDGVMEEFAAASHDISQQKQSNERDSDQPINMRQLDSSAIQLDINNSPLDRLLNQMSHKIEPENQPPNVKKTLPPFDYSLIRSAITDLSQAKELISKWPLEKDGDMKTALRLAEILSSDAWITNERADLLAESLTKKVSANLLGDNNAIGTTKPISKTKQSQSKSRIPVKKPLLSKAAETPLATNNQSRKSSSPKKRPDFEPVKQVRTSDEITKGRSRTPNFYNVRLSNAPVFLRRTNIKPPTLQFLDRTIAKLSPKRGDKPMSPSHPTVPMSIRELSSPKASETVFQKPILHVVSKASSPIDFIDKPPAEQMPMQLQPAIETEKPVVTTLLKDVALQTLPATASFGTQADLFYDDNVVVMETSAKKFHAVTQTEKFSPKDKTVAIDPHQNTEESSISSTSVDVDVKVLEVKREPSTQRRESRKHLPGRDFETNSAKSAVPRDDFDDRVAQWIQNEVLLRLAAQSFSAQPAKEDEKSGQEIAVQTDQLTALPIDQEIQTESFVVSEELTQTYCDMWIMEAILLEIVGVASDAYHQAQDSDRNILTADTWIQTDATIQKDEALQVEMSQEDKFLQTESKQDEFVPQRFDVSIQSNLEKDIIPPKVPVFDVEVQTVTEMTILQTEHKVVPPQEGIPSSLSSLPVKRRSADSGGLDASSSSSVSFSDSVLFGEPVSEVKSQTANTPPKNATSSSLESSSSFSLSTQLSDGEILTQFYSEGEIVDKLPSESIQKMLGRLPPVPETLLLECRETKNDSVLNAEGNSVVVSSESNPTTSSGHVTSLGEVTEIEFSQSHPSYEESGQLMTTSALLNLTESSESDVL